jgi:hypothetical protein
VRECSVLLYNVVLQDNASDSWRWYLDPTKGYSVRSAYRFLTNSGDLVVRSQDDNVWHQHIPSKVSLFVWRLLRNRLPTKDNLARRSVIPSAQTACVLGCGHPETANHLFLDCVFFGSIWYEVWDWLGISFVSPGVIRHHLHQFINMVGLPRVTHLFMKIIWFAFVWVLWKERNNQVFQQVATSPSTLLEKIKLNSFLWIKARQATFTYSYHEWCKHPLPCMGVLV